MRFCYSGFGICETGLLSLMTFILSLVDIESKPVGKCPLVDSKVNTIHLPDNENCSVYYTCQFGQPVAHACRTGLHFNPLLWKCDRPQNAGCFINSPAAVGFTKPVCPAVGICQEGSPPKNLPHAENCSLYCACNHGVLVTHGCPSGLWFNHKLDACDLPLNSDCQALCPASGNCPNSSSTSLLAHRFDCSLYCKCLNGTPFTAACASGLWFSSRKGICDAPEESGCVAETPELESQEGSKSDLHRATFLSTSSLLQQLATITNLSNTVDTTTVPYELKYSTSNSDEWITRKASEAKSTRYVPTASFVADSMTNSYYWKPILQSENVTSPYTNSSPQPEAIGPTTNFPAQSQLSNDVNIVPLTSNNPSPTKATTKSYLLVPVKSSHSTYIRDNQTLPSTSSTEPGHTNWRNVSRSSMHFPKTLSSKEPPVTIDNRIFRKKLPDKPKRSKSTFYCDADGICPQSKTISVAVVLPSRTRCDIFCLCEDGSPITMRCPRGRHFSATLKLCDDPSRAGCVIKSGCITCRPYLHLYCGVSVLMFLEKFSIS